MRTQQGQTTLLATKYSVPSEAKDSSDCRHRASKKGILSNEGQSLPAAQRMDCSFHFTPERFWAVHIFAAPRGEAATPCNVTAGRKNSKVSHKRPSASVELSRCSEPPHKCCEVCGWLAGSGRSGGAVTTRGQFSLSMRRPPERRRCWPRLRPGSLRERVQDASFKVPTAQGLLARLPWQLSATSVTAAVLQRGFLTAQRGSCPRRSQPPLCLGTQHRHWYCGYTIRPPQPACKYAPRCHGCKSDT